MAVFSRGKGGQGGLRVKMENCVRILSANLEANALWNCNLAPLCAHTHTHMHTHFNCNLKNNAS